MTHGHPVLHPKLHLIDGRYRIPSPTMLRTAVFALILGPAAAFAQHEPGTHTRQVVPDVTSADLAADDWLVVEATGRPGPSGGHMIMSFWKCQAGHGHAFDMRCLTTFDVSPNQVADVCSRAEHPPRL